MTLTTYRSPFARNADIAFDWVKRLCGVLQLSPRNAPRVQALTVLEDAALRELGIVPADARSIGA